ncbi:hypothetical protein [Cellulomonas uda]|uniref:Uncharacterized protein n=1 Tax=Cellulomonas uda TaxID=1714 RepID=A0A4Y3KD35_CELUD|nr:hypothetical protein [Cellulomonas uda]NII67840.1 hypothetical protein [Cellulomonas uda]GEA82361.1 hypothetical protein CUD01_28050 [Cellulomonas uda]
MTTANDARAASDLLERQAELLVAVATGGSRMDSVKWEYRERRDDLEIALRKVGLSDPFPWEEPSRWYAYYSANGMGTYASRREYIAELAAPIRARLRELMLGIAVEDGGPEHLDWPLLETRLREAKDRFAKSSTLDDFQDVGRRCRELLIDLANLAFDATMLPVGAEEPKGSDAKAKLGYASDYLFAGRQHAELRAVAKTTWDLANKVVHGGIGDVDAFATIQATVALVRIFQRATQP